MAEAAFESCSPVLLSCAATLTLLFCFETGPCCGAMAGSKLGPSTLSLPSVALRHVPPCTIYLFFKKISKYNVFFRVVYEKKRYSLCLLKFLIVFLAFLWLETYLI